MSEPPFEARDQAFFQIIKMIWTAVAGQHNLLVIAVQGVKRIEEFFLGRDFFSAKRLNIINQEQIQAPIDFFEIIHVTEPQMLQKVIDKGFRWNIFYTRIRNVF